MRLKAKKIVTKNYTELFIFTIPLQQSNFQHREIVTKPSKQQKRMDNYQTSRRNLMRSIDCNFTKNHTFLTLTFDPKIHPFVNSSIPDSLKYSKIELKRVLNRLRDLFPSRLPFRYICIPEIQPDSKNWHFHILVNRRYDNTEKLKNMHAIFLPTGCNLNIKNIRTISNLGLYVSKYVSKSVDFPLHAKKYISSLNLDKPVVTRYYSEESPIPYFNYKNSYKAQFYKGGSLILYYKSKNENPRNTNKRTT